MGSVRPPAALTMAGAVLAAWLAGACAASQPNEGGATASGGRGPIATGGAGGARGTGASSGGGTAGAGGNPAATGGMPASGGATGAAGAAGAKGDTGGIGPSNVFEAVRSDFVAIGSGADTGVATLSNLPAGDYLVIARLGMNTAGTTIARVVCTATLGSSSSQGIVQIGSDPNGVGQAPVAIVLAGSLASTGSAHVGCHSESLAGGAPFASDTHLEALKVGAATSQAVTS